jgi:hypothetical protein
MSKVEVLRQYEAVGFRIAYYILTDEALAMKTVTNALLELYKNEEFFGQPHDQQQLTVKKMFMKQSLQVIKCMH